MALPLRCNTRALASVVNASTYSSTTQLSPTVASTRKKSHKSNLELPKYKDVRHIEYAAFFKKLRLLDPDVDFSQQKEVHEALKSTIIETVGWKVFSLMRENTDDMKRRKRSGSKEERASFKSLERLRGEENKFWATPGGLEEPTTRDGLKLPSYTSMDQMKYRRFVEELRELNPQNPEIGSFHAEKALKQVVIVIIGKKDFDRMLISNAMGQHRTEWKRLLKEAVDYRRGRE